MRYFFIKIFWFFVNPIRRFYWFIVRPNTRGVKCIVENNGKFLMVKLNYAHHKWTFPGGGVKRKETFKDAAIREAKEETGINVKDVMFVGYYKTVWEYKNDTVEIYLGHTDDMDIKIDPVEIEEAKWFDIDKLPEFRSGSVDKALKIYDEFRFK